MKEKLYVSKAAADDDACCDDAVKHQNGIYYVKQECDCKIEEKEDKEEKVEKTTKELKIKKESK